MQKRRRKRKNLLSSFILSLSFSLTSVNAQAVTLVYSNDVQGQLEPCGCSKIPLGGLQRKSSLLHSLKKQGQKDWLQVDSGDLFFDSTEIPDGLKKQAKAQALFLVEGLNHLGLDFAVPGETDFALGFKVFLELKKKAKFQYLAANLKRKNGRTLFKESVTIRRKTASGKTLRIALIGLVGEALLFPKELKILSVEKTLKKILKKVKRKSDLIIVLSHQGLNNDKNLAKAFPEIDIIAGAHTQSFLQTPIQIGKTLILQSSYQNQYIGVLPLSHSLSSKNHRLVALDSKYDQPKNSKVESIVDRMKKEIAKINSQEKVSFENSPYPHFHTLPKCAECHETQFHFWRKTSHAKALTPLRLAKQIKNKACLKCHTLGLGSKHGFQSVEAMAWIKNKKGKRKMIEPEELSLFLEKIHKASSGEEKISLKGESHPMLEALKRVDRSFAPVQCENCHQNGGEHPFSVDYTKKVSKNVCLTCHTRDQAPAWYLSSGEPDWKTIEKKRKKIACPAGS